MLDRYSDVSGRLTTSFSKVRENNDDIRRKLEDSGLVHRNSDLASFPFNPMTCVIDGSIVRDRLLFTNIVAVAALARAEQYVCAEA